MHVHHLIPRHLGGTDDPKNLTPPISVELHAEFHKQLWLELGHLEDFIAWKALSGRMTSEQARLAAAKEGQKKSALYKESRKLTGKHLLESATKESCSKGGKTASVSLVKWQLENAEKFKKQCSLIGSLSKERQKIPHKYKGVVYESKKQLQKEHKMSNTKFYSLLASLEIERLEKQREISKRESNL